MKRCILLLMVFAGLSGSVIAQCGQRDVSGSWAISFGKGSSRILLTLKQSGSEISGRAQTEVSNSFGIEYGENDLKGHVTGDKIDFTIERNAPRFVITDSFNGAFDQDGRITGTALMVAFNANINVPWSSDRQMKCLYKAVGRLGVKHTEAPAGQGPGSAVPFIVATPNNITLPFGQTVGVANITWDAGPDHPYAEVWVKVDGRDETKVLEKGKGTLPVPITAGSTYVYILTDAGTTLATVTVQFRR